MKDLDLASHRVPFDFFNGILTRLNRQISDQFPLNFLSVLRVPRFSASITVKVRAG